jgi:hypothetical protein
MPPTNNRVRTRSSKGVCLPSVLTQTTIEFMSTSDLVRNEISRIYATESRSVYATLVRLLNDFDLAEEGLHEAFASAVEAWERDGIPANPRAWLVSAGRFKAIDSLRRSQRFHDLSPEIAARLLEATDANAARSNKGMRKPHCDFGKVSIDRKIWLSWFAPVMCFCADHTSETGNGVLTHRRRTRRCAQGAGRPHI